VLSLSAIEEGVRQVGDAGIGAIHAKRSSSRKLAMALADDRLESFGASVASPARHRAAWRTSRSAPDAVGCARG
jgi:hypothetical protein